MLYHENAPDHFDYNLNGIDDEPMPIDLNGQPRLYDFPGAANNGLPPLPDSGGWLDMGAYERP